MATQNDCCVKVCLRIRPQMAKEKIEGCHVCTAVTPGEPQVLLGKDKAFTFDFVFDADAQQHQIYATCVHKLIEGCLEGYNATVFAYGQTGSGKTYTMGTGFDVSVQEEEQGIVPRAVRQLFQGMERRRAEAQAKARGPPPEFKVSAQFLELYNEEVLDLFDESTDPSARQRKSNVRIHEDADGAIYVTGVTSRLVSSEDELLQCLKRGALSRTTASTQMNAQSSRSHAIFTVHVCQMRLCQQGEPIDGESISQPGYETLTAKFHFVDLAGSERLKRTGATGDRAREGISINCGLLALGNVISALGDQSKKSSHVPYRDSKLTRLLQDSLGGNSRTLMIACVSPSDRDFMETLNTLKYANRARNIKNKVVLNQDKTSQQISALRAEINRLQLELTEYKMGKRVVTEDGSDGFSDLYQENSLLLRENGTLRTRVKALQETVQALNGRAARLLSGQAGALLGQTGNGNEEIGTLIQNYLREIEEIRSKLLESEATNEALRCRLSLLSARPMAPPSPGPAPRHPPSSLPAIGMETDTTDVIQRAKQDLERLRKMERKQRRKSPKKEKGMKKRPKLQSGDGELDRSDAEEEEEEEEEEQEDQEESDLNGAEEEEDRGEEGSGSEEEEEESVSDSEEKENFRVDLADLTCEIEIKQKLIDELENSQRRLALLKLQYEEKLLLLQNKIRDTQLERDHVLSSLMSMESYTEERAGKIRAEYERRLLEMNRDLQKLQAAQKEHGRLLKSQTCYERQLRKLQAELCEMKKTKVALMKQMKEEQQRRRMIEAKRNREIAQLRKEQRRQEFQIRALESQKRQQELVLRRRTQEVSALRRQARPMSDRVAGRAGRRPSPRDSGAELSAGTATTASSEAESAQSVSSAAHRWSGELSGFTSESQNGGSRRNPQRSGVWDSLPRTSRRKWQALERQINDIITQRMIIANAEADMERLIKKRQELSAQQEALSRRRASLLGGAAQSGDRLLLELQEEMEALAANVDYINDSLSDCRATVVQLEEAKEEMDAADSSMIIGSCSLSEARHLLHLLLKAFVEKGLQVAQKDARIRLLESQLLQTHMIGRPRDRVILDSPGGESTCVPEVPTLSLSLPSENGYSSTDEEVSEVNQLSDGSLSQSFQMKVSSSQEDLKLKVEPRLSAQIRAVSAEFLGPVLEPSARHMARSLASLSEVQESGRCHPRWGPCHREVSRTLSLPGRGTSLPMQSQSSGSSPLMRRKSHDRGLSSRNPETSLSPPTSPPLRPRSDRNVFSRLTGTRKQGSALDRGVISSVGGVRGGRAAPLQCVSVAVGHSKPVLCLDATDELLFTGSKDRTCKMWNLETGQEIVTLKGHPNNVVSVKYCSTSCSIFTVSSSFIRVWDVRDTTKCVRTLTSSGQVISGDACAGTSFQGELQINQIALNPAGTALYAAAGNTVRIWDLCRLQATGRLVGHAGPVMCLTVSPSTGSRVQVITGSKDHYIKVFDVAEGMLGNVVPAHNFEPPHYDGIECLAIRDGVLFSSSRDNGIKKWDLEKQELIQQTPNAHRDWVCSLALPPGYALLVSGCRAGVLKLWNMGDFSPAGEVKGHDSPINAICANSRQIFTASSDMSVKIWLAKLGRKR